MSTTLENPVDEIRRIKAELAAEDGYDLSRMTQSLRKIEAELRAQGRIFADDLSTIATGSSVVREDPPLLS